jgi:hypothetical protein
MAETVKTPPRMTAREFVTSIALMAGAAVKNTTETPSSILASILPLDNRNGRRRNASAASILRAGGNRPEGKKSGARSGRCWRHSDGPLVTSRQRSHV